MLTNLWRARQAFWSGAVVGVILLLLALTGVGAQTGWERVGAGLAGLGVIAGCGGTLALSYEKLAEGDVFPVRLGVRVGFMLVGPGAVLAKVPSLLEMDRGWLLGAIGCAVTVIPFGISLALLLRRGK